MDGIDELTGNERRQAETVSLFAATNGPRATLVPKGTGVDEGWTYLG